MIVNFRQGIVSYPVGFLTKVGTPTGARVALNITSDTPLILHFAHRDTNYIVVQKTSVGLTPPTGAFGGPFLAGIDYYLYADIDLSTGVVTWGNTTLTPVNQATTPSATQTVDDDGTTNLVQMAGRHWFKTAAVGGADDTTYPPYQMYVRNAGNTAWEPKVRVFVARYEEGAFFISMSVNSANPNTAIKFSGTQVGNLTQNSAGFLIYDSSNVAYKNSDGTFVTTEDVIKTGMLLGADLRVGNQVITAVADSALPGYTVVRFPTFGHVAPVNLYNLDQSFFGFVEAPASINEQVQVILEGIITNSAWNWSTANAPIYADNTGQLTETKPSINDAEPVAFALSATQIVLRPSRVEVGLVDHATDTMFGAVRLTSGPDEVAGYLDVIYDPLVGDTPGGTLASETGLSVTNTYTAELVIDGTQYDVVYGPSDFPGAPTPTVPTITDLVDFLNNTSPAGGGLMGVGVASLESATTLRITSATTGPTSTVRLTSGSAVPPNLDLFESVSNYSTPDVPVDGYYDSLVPVLVNGQLVLDAGTEGAPSLTFAGELDKGMFSPGAGEIGFSIGGTQELTLSASELTMDGAVVGYNDNATALRVRGPQHATEGGADVQSYSGIFYNDGYDGIGTLKTRFITGGNTEMDVVLISPHQLQLVGADATTTDGQIWMTSWTNVVINARGAPEDPAGNQLIIDRSNTASTGSGNTSDVVISTSGGSLQIHNLVAATATGEAVRFDEFNAHTSDATIHFTEASIDHLNIMNIGTNSHADIDTHIADATIHFTEASIDHANILNIGTNTHAQIDTHIADGTIHFTQAAISITASQVSDFTTASQAVPLVYTTQAAPYAVATTDEVVLMTGTGNATLPAPAGGKSVTVKNVGAGVITVVPNAAESIDGAASFNLPTQYDAVTVMSDGTDWLVI